MDRYTFIATMADHVAWPLTTLIVVALFFFRLRWLAKFIKGIKYKDLELSIRDDFTEARVVAEVLEVERKPVQVSNAQTDKILRLVEIDASIAIIDVWRRLEQEVIRLIQHNGFMRYMNPVRFIEYLVRLGKLSDGDLVLFRKLRDIRNPSTHAHEGNVLSRAEVFEFNSFVELLIEKLETIRQKPDYLNLPPDAVRQG